MGEPRCAPLLPLELLPLALLPPSSSPASPLTSSIWDRISAAVRRASWKEAVVSSSCGGDRVLQNAG